jgi:single-strand DNA-binding protein
MASLNKVMLIGNAGKDAELRYLSTGTAQSQFSLAVNSRRRGQNGEWEDQTEWFNIVIWADQAERVSQYITKGKQVYVEGRLQTRTWDDDQGVKHYRTEVIAQTIQLLGSRQDAGEAASPAVGATAPRATPAAAAVAAPSVAAAIPAQRRSRRRHRPGRPAV